MRQHCPNSNPAYLAPVSYSDRVELNHFEIGHADPTSLEGVPPSPGAVAMFAADGSCLLVAVTGDAREFCKKRLNPERGGSLAEVVHHIECARCDSMFEAQWAYLTLARDRLGEAAAAVVDRMRCWFLRLDHVACTWDITQLEQGWEPDERFTVVGPMPDKHAAERLGQMLDAGFDLCRFPNEVRRAPHGRACVYHEMGRCPAPCDGSEPWLNFAARFNHASLSLQSSDTLSATLETHMNAAARAQEFERAGEMQRLVDALGTRRGRALAHFGRLENWERIVVSPIGSARVRIWSWRASGLTALCETPRQATAAERIDLAHHIETRTCPPCRALTRQDIELFWVMSQRLFLARRAEQILLPAEAIDPKRLKSALLKHAKITDETEEFTLL
ncbi:MAG: hypothetical protein KF757_02445 [Phycisphaeraceae bacterium]|nr:hypothetical protein [Phycisphaeraceae bacterium]MCW5762072.1 hypothetical protein [Phycisphaeraceae bacterium]